MTNLDNKISYCERISELKQKLETNCNDLESANEIRRRKWLETIIKRNEKEVVDGILDEIIETMEKSLKPPYTVIREVNVDINAINKNDRFKIKNILKYHLKRELKGVKNGILKVRVEISPKYKYLYNRDLCLLYPDFLGDDDELILDHYDLTITVILKFRKKIFVLF